MPIALVTGASGEIGTAICKKLAEDGFDIIAQYNRHEPNFSFDRAEVYPFYADLAKETDIVSLSSFCNEKGGADVLVNNAGVSIVDLFQSVKPEDADLLFDVNVRGAMSLTQKILPSMIHKKAGKIVNISSIWGVYGASCEVHYSASKGALISFTKALAKEVGQSGINVNCVAPGFVDTKMNAHLSEDEVAAFVGDTILGRAVQPAEVADLVSFLVSESSSAISGQCIIIGE